MRILYITHFDANDINKCSGTVYHIKKMLEDMGHDVIVVDNLKLNKLYKCSKKAVAKLLGKEVLIEREPYILKHFAKEIRKRTKDLEYDLVFSPTSLYYTFYKDEKPMVFYTDANFGGMVDYYIYRKDYNHKSIENGFNQETLAIKNTDLVIYTSEWAKQTGIEYHKLNTSKCKVINRGANIKHLYSKKDIFRIIEERNVSRGINECSFMFLGTDWIRKGGLIACEIIRMLNEKFNIKATLNVVGCIPNLTNNYKKYVNIVGFLDKSKEEDYLKLEEVFKKSDFFLLPTRQEAQGISYAEACSWGIPVIGTNTGGVSDIIKSEVNGLIFDYEDGPEEYALQIMKYINNRDEYIKLSKSTYCYFEDRLTWYSVGRRIDNALQDLFKV